MKKSAGNIIMICYRNLAMSTGEGRLIANRANHLYREFGITTHVFALISSRHKMLDNAENEFAGLVIHRFEFGGIFSLPLVLMRLTKAVNRFSANCVDVKAVIYSGAISHLAYPFIKKTGKCIVDIHGTLDEWLDYPPLHVFKTMLVLKANYYFWLFLERFVVNKADAAWVVTEELGRHITTRYGCATYFVIPCGVDKMLAQEAPEARKKWRKRFGFTEENVVLTYSGGLAPWQMVPQTMKFFNSFLQLKPQARFLCLVLEPEKAKALFIENGGDSEVAVFCRLPSTDMAEALLAADIGIVLREKNITNQVAFPNKFAEYLAAGLIVVTSSGLVEPARQISRHGVGIVQEPEERLTAEGMKRLQEIIVNRTAGWMDYVTKSQSICSQWSDMTKHLVEVEEWLR